MRQTVVEGCEGEQGTVALSASNAVARRKLRLEREMHILVP